MNIESFRDFIAEATIVNVADGYYIFDDDDVNYDELIDQAQAMIAGSGINILRSMDLEYVAHENGKVLGGLWIGRLGDEYSFDVIVSKEHQGQGIGRQLIMVAMSDFRDFQEANENAHIMAHVVNPILVPTLQRLGFTEVFPNRPHTGRMFRYPPDHG